MPRVEDDVLKEINNWNSEKCAERISSVIKATGSYDGVKSAFTNKPINNPAVLQWLDNPKGSENTLGASRFGTIAKLALVLDNLGVHFSLDEMIRGYEPKDHPLKRMQNLETLMERFLAFDTVAERILGTFVEECQGKLKAVLQDEREAIRAGDTGSQSAHLIGPEIRAIGQCCQHIRVIANHLNFGISCNDETGRLEVRSGRNDFWVIVERLQTTKFTFILPSDIENNEPGTRPSPFGENTQTWKQLAVQFREFYSAQGGIDEETWNKNITFAHTPMPIPVGTLMFSFSNSGRKRLCDEHKDFADRLQQDEEHVITSPDGGMHVGITIPSAGVARFASLLDRRGVVHAANAFVQYWDSTQYSIPPGSSHPCDGLPVGPSKEYRSKLLGNTEIEGKPASDSPAESGGNPDK